MKNTMQKAALFAALAAGTALTSGCASYLNTGEEEFSCSGMPGSIYCHSARDVYEATNDGTVPSPMRKDEAYNKDCRDCVRSEDVNPDLAKDDDAGATGSAAASNAADTSEGTTLQGAKFESDTTDAASAKNTGAATKNRKSLSVKDDELIENYVTPALPDRPVPIRTPSQVMRIWVAPYVDANGDLNAPGFVYTEIEPRRWVITTHTDGGQNSTAFAPLEAADEFSSTGTDVPHYNSLEIYQEKRNEK